MPLTDTAVRSVKADAKPLKLTDGGGLYLLVTSAGGKWWRFDYRFGGKRKTLSMGVYPDVPLKQARDLRDEARKLIASGVDPGAARKAAKAASGVNAVNTFEAIAREWIDQQAGDWSERHKEDVTRRLELDAFPAIGARPIAAIDAPELLAMLRRIEARGVAETAKRILQCSGQVFRYAIATGRASQDPSASLRGVLKSVKVKHHASIVHPSSVGGLLRAIDGYEGSFVVRCALRLAPLVFVRPGELRHAEWSEINIEGSEWRIPGAKMKMRLPHIVPLSRQAVTVLRELHPLTGSGRYVFPGERTRERPISDNTINASLRRLGFGKDEMTGHGFRSMASTLLNEQGWNRDAIERQLADAERNAVRAAYNYAEHLPDRRRMMQAWADYLDKLKAGAKVVSFAQL
jgi:integrase